MTKFSVPEMSCGHCKSTIERAIGNIDANAVINVDLRNRTLSVKSSMTDVALINALNDEGYEAAKI